MSYKWPDKDKDETLDYSVDWSRLVGSDLISSSNWFVDDADGEKQEAGESNTPINGLIVLYEGSTVSTNGKVTTVRLSSGTNNVRYRLTNAVTTASGLVYERSIFLRVREK